MGPRSLPSSFTLGLFTIKPNEALTFCSRATWSGRTSSCQETKVPNPEVGSSPRKDIRSRIKVMVSTMAGGDVARYDGTKDTAMLNSVTDIMDLNPILRRILANGAGAICGMVEVGSLPDGGPEAARHETVAIAAFGVTTPAAMRCRAQLEEAGYDTRVFHANDIFLELGERHVLPAVKQTLKLAGVCGTDPTRDMPRFLGQIAGTGFSGVINYPTVARFVGLLRRDLESVGLGFARETEMIAMARELDLYTTCYVRTRDESRQMATAGVDLIVPHVGLTTRGPSGQRMRSRWRKRHDPPRP